MKEEDSLDFHDMTAEVVTEYQHCEVKMIERTTSKTECGGHAEDGERGRGQIIVDVDD